MTSVFRAWRQGRRRLSLLASLSIATCCGCVSAPQPGDFNTLQETQLAQVYARPDFIVRPGDKYDLVIQRLGSNVRGLKQELIVPPDSQISLVALESTVSAKGLTTAELELRIAEAYQPLFGPGVVINVTLKFFDSEKVVWFPDEILVTGRIRRPMTVTYRKGMTAVRAVARVGGWRKQGNPERIVLLRRNDRGETITREIDVLGILEHEHTDDVEVFPGDIVYIPRTNIAFAGLWVHQFIRRMIFVDPTVILRSFFLTNS
jgi:protein involved in polysaccharide export with SLBB domain